MGFAVPVIFRSYGKKASAPAGPVTLIYDTFTAADGTSLAGRAPSPTNTPGNAWATLPGYSAVKIYSNTIKPYSTANCAAVVDAGTANVTIEVDATTSDPPATGTWGEYLITLFRFASTSDWCRTFIRAVYTNDGVGAAFEAKFYEDSTVRASAAPARSNTTTYAFKTVVSGGAGEFFIDGVSVLSYGAFGKTGNTKHGVHITFATSVPDAFNYMDNFKVMA